MLTSSTHIRQLALDLVGVFVFALSGGLVAVKKRLDLFGVLVLAGAAALGGGVMRDLLIGAMPPVGHQRLAAADRRGPGRRPGDLPLPPGRRADLRARPGPRRRRPGRLRRRRRASRRWAPGHAARSPRSSSAASPRSAAASCATCSPARCPRCCGASCTRCPPCSGPRSSSSPHAASIAHRPASCGAPSPRLRRADGGGRARPQRPATPAHRRPPVSDPDGRDRPTTDPLEPYDAILLLSLRRPGGARRGHALPAHGSPPAAASRTSGSRQVGEHYYRFGGRSPINDQNRALLAALRAELDRARDRRPAPLGQPQLRARSSTDALREAHAAGCTAGSSSSRRAPTPRYSSCRQYREDLADAAADGWPRTGIDARDRQGPALLQPPRLRPRQHPPGHRGACAARCATVAGPAGSRLLFVTHSIPDGDGRHVRPRRRRGQRSTSRQHLALAAADHRRGQRDPRPRPDRRAGLLLPVRARRPSRGSSPTSTTASRSWPPRAAAGRRRGARSASSPTTWRSSTTSTPRPPRRPSGSGCSSCGCPRSASTPSSSPGWSTCVAGAGRRGARRGPPIPTWPGRDAMPSVCAPGCCPNLREARPALCGRD